MPQLKVMSLNVGRFLQERTREYLKRLVSGEEYQPDVLCLQDIPERDLPWLRVRWPHLAFAPMTNHLIYGVRAVVGIAILSRYPMASTNHTVWGNGVLKDLQGVNNKNERIAPTAENDRLIEATEDRVAICATVVTTDGVKYSIATTHGFWVRGGKPNDMQHQSTRSLMEFLSAEAGAMDGLVLAADLNFGRGGEIYNTFVEKKGPDNKGFHDCVPLAIESTLDPDHPASKKGLKIVSDYFMARRGYGGDFILYDVPAVSDVRLHPGVSDHCALSATVSWVPG